MDTLKIELMNDATKKMTVADAPVGVWIMGILSVLTGKQVQTVVDYVIEHNKSINN